MGGTEDRRIGGGSIVEVVEKGYPIASSISVRASSVNESDQHFGFGFLDRR
jgi:hypothetical protein